MPVPVPVDQLGAALSRIRAERDKSLREIALETGVSASTLSRIERGGTPDLDVASTVAEWLGIEIVAGAPSPERATSDQEMVELFRVHLRAKKRLPASTADAIADTIQLILQSAKRSS